MQEQFNLSFPVVIGLDTLKKNNLDSTSLEERLSTFDLECSVAVDVGSVVKSQGGQLVLRDTRVESERIVGGMLQVRLGWAGEKEK